MTNHNFHALTPGIQAAGTTSVGLIFAERARRDQNRDAIEMGPRRLTYGELNERVNRLANVLLGSGIERKDRVGLLSHNSIEYLEVILAAAKIGAIVCCQNWRLSAAELTHCINLAEPKIIIKQPELNNSLEISNLVPHQTIDLGAEYEALLAKASGQEPNQLIASEDGLIVLYTSGTTGLPKGALISHRAMITRTMVYAAELNVPSIDTFFAWSPLFHMGAADQSIATLLRGGKVFVTDGFELSLILPALEHNKTQWFSLLPGIIGNLIEVVKTAKPKMLGIGLVGGMADLITPDQIGEVSELFQAPYLNTFGSTETGIPPATGGLIPIGVIPENLAKRQSGYCEVRLLDLDDQDVADGEPGEIVVRGPTLFSGYVKNKETNDLDFRDGWFHMGDVMRRNPDGTLDFIDRVKYMIKSGGENIYPAEIEKVIMTDSRISEAAVIKKQDDKWGEVPVAVVARHDDSLSEEDVVELCLQQLARYKRPKKVLFISADQFPRSTTGKIQRHVLEKQLT